MTPHDATWGLDIEGHRGSCEALTPLASFDVSVTQSQSSPPRTKRRKYLANCIHTIVCPPATHGKIRSMMGSESSDYRPKRHPSESPHTPNKKRPPVGEEASLTDPEDAITQDEIQGAEAPPENGKPGTVRNACKLHPHLRSVRDQLIDHLVGRLSSLRAHGPETQAKT